MHQSIYVILFILILVSGSPSAGTINLDGLPASKSAKNAALQPVAATLSTMLVPSLSVRKDSTMIAVGINQVSGFNPSYARKLFLRNSIFTGFPVAQGVFWISDNLGVYGKFSAMAWRQDNIAYTGYGMHYVHRFRSSFFSFSTDVNHCYGMDDFRFKSIMLSAGIEKPLETVTTGIKLYWNSSTITPAAEFAVDSWDAEISTLGVSVNFPVYSAGIVVIEALLNKYFLGIKMSVQAAIR